MHAGIFTYCRPIHLSIKRQLRGFCSGRDLSALPSFGTCAVAANSDWPGYNRKLTSERFSPLSTINVRNVAQLKLVCTYDTRLRNMTLSRSIQTHARNTGACTRSFPRAL